MSCFHSESLKYFRKASFCGWQMETQIFFCNFAPCANCIYRQMEARKVAVGGFLLILKNFKVLGGMSSSQASSQQSFASTSSQVKIRFCYAEMSDDVFHYHEKEKPW